MARRICGWLGPDGEPCALDAGDCPDHDQGARPAAGGGRDLGRGEPSSPDTQAPEAVARRDVRGTAWWVVERLATGQLAAREGAPLVSALRLLSSLGPEPMDEEEALAEVELRGIIMAGLQPRDEAEWALARKRFSEEALQLLGRPEPDDDEDDDDLDDEDDED